CPARHPSNFPRFFVPISLHSEMEQLPKELVWNIFGRAPEEAFNLRLVSKTIKLSVDELAIRSIATPCTNEITLWQEGQASIVISNIFLLGYILRDFETIRKFSKIFWENSPTLSYQWKTRKATLPAMEFLRGFIGKRVRKARLCGCDFRNYAKILNGVHVEHLKIAFEILSEGELSGMQHFMGGREIPQITISMSHVFLDDPETFLHYISSNFRSIHIDQTMLTCEDDDSTSFILGMHPSGWVPVILDMFNNKMDKLLISTKHTNWNGAAFIDSIIQMLPRLGQRIWLEMSSGFLDHEPFRNVHNDYVIQVTEPGIRQVLSIKHMSRVEEQFE
ncbi:hypothetical protein PMAYCL1PPCAC_21417, partial [Pristionchus mayeri]